MARRDWTREELLLAMNLYCQLPFGRLHRGNAEVIRLATAIGRTPSSVAMKLCNLASLDPVHKQRGIKGLSSVSVADRAIWNEFHNNWEQLAVTSEELRQQHGLTTPAANTSDKLVENNTFLGATETVGQTKVRLAQRFFRKSVMASYAGRCSITDINLPALLIASHIAPWSDYPDHRTNPRNGICLSRLHDAAFDRGLITFDEDLRLVVSTELRSALPNQVLRDSFGRFEGKRLRLPEKFCPEPSFLTLHRQRVFRT